jgi:hypothetical protein
MKHVFLSAGKALTLLFTAAFLVACSGTDTEGRRRSSRGRCSCRRGRRR